MVIPKLSCTKYGIDGASWSMLQAYHGILRWPPLSTFQSYIIYPSLPSFLCLWMPIAVKWYRMEPYSILQASCITATPNNTSVRHICIQNRSNLPNVTSECCEIQCSAKYRLLGSRSDVTAVARPLIFDFSAIFRTSTGHKNSRI